MKNILKAIPLSFVFALMTNINVNAQCGTTQSVPYIENFDANSNGTFGTFSNGWVGVQTTGFRWQTEIDQTLSTGTGPSADHTTGTPGGGSYLYSEASSGTTGAVADLESPCVDLSGLTSPIIDFWYHKFGAAMGDLYIDVFRTSNSSWVMSIDSIVGETHSSLTDPWLKKTVSLSSFVGEIIKIRFRAVRGTSYTSDICIDDVKVWEPAPVTAAFTISNATPAYQEVVTFTDQSTSSPSIWFWDFGDGTTSSDQNPTHAYSSTGTKTIQLIVSNGAYTDTVTNSLVVQLPPMTFSNDTLEVTLNCGDSSTSNITFYNGAGSNLGFEINAGGEGLPLDSVLARINRNHTSITSLIPNMYSFLDGVTGTTISDGGNDMYDTGNRLNTNISGTAGIPYSDNTIIASTSFGATGAYFTRKVNGLFVLAADVDNITNFNITGNLGADGSGNSDGVILSQTFNGNDYRAFINRTYNAGDPSINRMVIVENNPSASHTFLTATTDEDHQINGLASSTRIYYLLFAAQSGLYVTDAEMTNIMDAFLQMLVATPEYISISPLSDTLISGDSAVVGFSFNSMGLNAGAYTANITVETTIPQVNTYNITTILHVVGTPEYTMSDTCLDFGSILQNATASDSIILTNYGCDTLYFTSATTTHGDFSVASIPSMIVPGASGSIMIEFNPSSVATISGDLVLNTNGVDTSICLSGVGLVAPVATVTPSPFIVNLPCGDSLIQNIVIHNTGGSGLNVSGSTIGGAGIYDTSLIHFTTTNATTTHNFILSASNMDTLFVTVAVNGDFDQNIEFAEVYIDGNYLGNAGDGNITIGLYDSITFAITGSLLATVLADGQITISMVNDGQVGTGFANALDNHAVVIYTNGDTWLSGTIPTTTIAAGDSIIIPVTFYSFGLYQGNYNSVISVESNDPGSPTEVPVILNLVGSAHIGLSDACLHYGNGVVNVTEIDTLEIFNTGCDTLFINTLTSNNTDYTLTLLSSSGVVLPGESYFVIVDFTPSSLGSSNGTILITSNLADTTVCLTGSGIKIVSDFSVSGQNQCSGRFTFSDESIGVPASWLWIFGDGNTSSLQNPTHLYSALGTYTVQLIVCNSTGCDTSETTVTPTFLLDYDVVTTGTLETGSVITFKVAGSNILTTTWDFGDGNSQPGLIATHTYSDTGTYIVSGDIITSDPCVFVVYDTITITDGSLSMEATMERTELSVYPNPSKGKFTLNMKEFDEDVAIEIYDAQGKKVYRKERVILNNYVLDFSVKDGMYWLRVLYDGETISEKTLILRK